MRSANAPRILRNTATRRMRAGQKAGTHRDDGRFTPNDWCKTHPRLMRCASLHASYATPPPVGCVQAKGRNASDDGRFSPTVWCKTHPRLMRCANAPRILRNTATRRMRAGRRPERIGTTVDSPPTIGGASHPRLMRCASLHASYGTPPPVGCVQAEGRNASGRLPAGPEPWPLVPTPKPPCVQLGTARSRTGRRPTPGPRLRKSGLRGLC
jgi:hypothetical protein